MATFTASTPICAIFRLSGPASEGGGVVTVEGPTRGSPVPAGTEFTISDAMAARFLAEFQDHEAADTSATARLFEWLNPGETAPTITVGRIRGLTQVS